MTFAASFGSNLGLREKIKMMIEKSQKDGIHVISLKIPSHCGKIMEAAISCGFKHHHANPKYSLLNFCLKSHGAELCTFPAYKSISVGVTAIVFNPDRTKMLVVEEKLGMIKKEKPPTGTVEYGEKQETPLDAVARELFEETGIKVDSSKGVLVAHSWTNNYRDNNPDTSYFYAFVLDSEQIPVAQESEISKVTWTDVKEFMKEPEEEKSRPWQLRQGVIAGYNALDNIGNSWKAQTTYLTTGKPVQFYSVPTRNTSKE